jgi:hypothetical protein
VKWALTFTLYLVKTVRLSQESVRRVGLNKYMDIQCVTGIDNKCGTEIRKGVAVVLVTEAFVQRIEEYGRSGRENGCARELKVLTRAHQRHLYFFMDKSIRREDAVVRLESAMPEWKGLLNDKLAYSIEDADHIKLLADSVLYHAYRGETPSSTKQADADPNSALPTGSE